MTLFENTGIRKKMAAGCFVLALVLFFSSVTSVFEFVKMNRYVSSVVTDNINSINSARELLFISEHYNVQIMDGIVLDQETGDLQSIKGEDELIASFVDLRDTFVTPEEKAAADSVLYAYAAYMQVVNEVYKVWESDQETRQDWYFGRLEPIYLKFRGYLMQLTSVCQDALIHSSHVMQQSFYRSLMPGLISVILGIVMVVLFYYFMNFYLISPVLKIIGGVGSYRRFDRPYDVKLENDDEIQTLNGMVRDIIDENQVSRKRS